MAAKKTKKPETLADSVRKIEKRWGRELTEAGWTAVPFVLLSHQRRLGLSPLDLNIILQIAKHWWEADSAPFPSKRSIAEAIGVHESTVRKHVKGLEDAGLIQRSVRRNAYGGQKSNAYQLGGLIKKAKPLAREVLNERERRKNANRRQAKPRLTLIEGEGA